MHPLSRNEKGFFRNSLFFEINIEKGHGGPSKNRTTKTTHVNGKL